MTDYSLADFNINQEKKGKTTGKPRVLVVPLDWGLGHATRCIPIIAELLKQECEVWVAGEGPVEALLRNEFKNIQILKLRGYRIRYSGSGAGFLWSIIKQLPKISSIISYENKWLKEQVSNYDFDAVISDNRFGLYHEQTPCVFITHQLNIKTPLGAWNKEIIRKWNYQYIHRFSECWVPDNTNNKNSLAGELSHPFEFPKIPVHYIGLLSRLKKQENKERKGHLTILLSGPEPQRSILENKLIDELVKYNGTADIIRGLPDSDIIIPSTNQLRFYNHLPVDEVNQKINEAEFIISRSGYSTVMDIVHLQKKSILIPTPGQTEQKYLGNYLMKNRIAYCVHQNEFSLNALENARQFAYELPVIGENNLQKIIQRFIATLKEKK